MNKIITYCYIIYNRIRFRSKGIKFGKNFRVQNSLYFRKSKYAKLTIGDNFKIISGGGYNPISSNVKGYIRLDDSAEIVIGNNCGLSSTVLWAKEKITIGNNVLIGGGCLILDNDCHSLDYRIRNGSISGKNGENIDAISTKKAPVVIGDDVLVGARCIILKGVTIGSKCIIGAGSVVSQSIPAGHIAAGNPCKIIKEIDN